MLERKKSISQMTQDQKDEELRALRAQKQSRGQRIKKSLAEAVNYAGQICSAIVNDADKKISVQQGKLMQYAQKGIAILPDCEAKASFSSWIKIFYEKYKSSNWKWLVRIIVGAIVFYIIGEALLYFGGEWLASTRIVQKFSFLLQYLKPIVRIVSSAIGSVIGALWNAIRGQ